MTFTKPLTAVEYAKLSPADKAKYNAWKKNYIEPVVDVLEPEEITGFDSMTPEEQALWDKTETRDFASSELPLDDGDYNVTFTELGIVGVKGHFVRFSFVTEDAQELASVVTSTANKAFIKDAIIGSTITITVKKGYVRTIAEYVPQE